jgi:hypothetical protein
LKVCEPHLFSFDSFFIQGLLTSFVVIITAFVIVGVVEMEPLTHQFFASLIVGLLISRLLWVFESERLFNLMFGYELDRALILRKSEKGLLDLHCFSTASKISGTHDDPTSHGAGEIDEFMAKDLKKYRKLKNKAELNAEIGRVKSEIEKRQVQLACLENMVFTVEGENDSSSQSESKSSLNNSEADPPGV